MRKIIPIFILSIIAIKANSQQAIGIWPFDNNAKDISGNNNHGIIKGNVLPVMDRFGNPCGAYHFDGVSSYIEVPNSRSLESVSSAFTISVWYRFDKNRANNWLTVLCKGATNVELPGNPQYRLQVQQNSAPVINTCSPTVAVGSSTISVNTDFTECDLSFDKHVFEMGKWGFYALVYNGQEVITYMNGVKVFEFPYTSAMVANQLSLFIGMDEPGNTEYFEGSLDDLNLFNAALTEPQIQKLYNESRKDVWNDEEYKITKPGNQVFNLPKNNCTINANYNIPAVSNSSCSKVSLAQVAGLPPGSDFSPGKHLVVFEAASTSGYRESYGYYIIVKDVTPPILYTPSDTVIYITEGKNDMRYTYVQPHASDNCAVRLVQLISGAPSGGHFNIGKNMIRYQAIDINGNTSEKTFTVEVRMDTITKGSAKIDTMISQKIDTMAVARLSLFPPTDTVKNYVPKDFPKREKKEQGTIEVNSSRLIIELYDRGVYDGDTVSIFLNNVAILSRKEVVPSGFAFKIQIDSTRDNELIFYAENIGKYPPNTAWMIVDDGIERFKITVVSTLNSNGVIRIRKRK